MLKVTKQQADQLDLLRLEAMLKKIELEQAREAYEQAEAREQAVEAWALEQCSVKVDEEGEPITEAYQLPEEVYMSEYLTLLQRGYKELYGLEYAWNYTPVYSEYHRPFLQAQKAYRLTGVEFLRICGQSEVADDLEAAIKTYLPPRIAEQLDKITDDFIGGKAK